METSTIKENLKNACEKALLNLEKIEGQSPIEESIVSDLEYVLGSYEEDGNPTGLYEKGSAALVKLHAVESNYPDMVDDKVMATLKTALSDYADMNNLEPVHETIDDM